jgi:3-oxoacyl-(acyl-carrier-protein) synthase
VTVPEENRPKTTSTDDVIETPREKTTAGQGDGATGRTMREAMEEAGLSPDDVRDET